MRFCHLQFRMKMTSNVDDIFRANSVTLLNLMHGHDYKLCVF